MNAQDAYLRAILATLARQTFPLEKILEALGPKAGEKQYRAFNMCDGTHTQSDIIKELGLDSSNFSKTLARWVDAGVCIRVRQGKEERPVHVYPLPESAIKKAAKQ